MEALLYSDSLYTTVNGPAWKEAEASAREVGGHLVTINSARENAFLTQNFGQAYDQAWIGLSDEISEGSFYWATGELLAETGYTNWRSPEPNNEYYSSSGLTANHGAIYFTNKNWYLGGDGVWADLPNKASIEQFSYFDQMVGIAEIPVTLSIDLPETPTEGAGEVETSIYLSAGTETSGNLAEGATVFWTITGIDADDLASGALTGSGTITDGKLDIQHSLVQDEDKGEIFEVSVFSDESRTSEYQIGTTASVAIEEGTPDPLTGILDLPGKVNLKNKGVTPFSLYGSDEIDVSKIVLVTLGFGLSTDNLVAASTMNNGSIDAAFEDLNQDGILDLSVKVDTSSLASIISKGTIQINAFGQYADGIELIFGMAAGDSVLFV